jgi:hypothetical protein
MFDCSSFARGLLFDWIEEHDQQRADWAEE